MAEGRAIRRAIASDFAAIPGLDAHVIVTLDSRWPDEPGPWTVVNIGQGDLPGRLLELATDSDYTVIIAPETMGILACLTRLFEQAGLNTLGSSSESIALTGDKERLGERLEARGIATPRSRTLDPAQGLPVDAEYPAVLKPIDGAGSVGTYFLDDAQSLPESARRMSSALLQPFVPGTPMSSSFLVDDANRAWLIGMGQQRITIENGRFQYKGGLLPRQCHDAESVLREAVDSVPGLRGFVGVDFIWDSECGRATVLEINPRPTTSCVGLTRVLPLGHLASAWLTACGAPGFARDSLVNLASLVRGKEAISFDADGTMREVDRGVLTR
jgi:predicted ATP-grasp superfamily ATP-dependent carboligase